MSGTNYFLLKFIYFSFNLGVNNMLPLLVDVIYPLRIFNRLSSHNLKLHLEIFKLCYMYFAIYFF